MEVLNVKVFIIKKRVIYIFLIAVIVLISFLLLYNFYKVKETFNRDIYYKGKTQENIIAFTCNVDWGGEYIPDMLNILKENNTKITFFVTGKWAEKNPDLLKKMYYEGHEIGNHGYMHRDYGELSYELNKQEIQKCQEIINEILGESSMYFAPPSGSYNDNTIKACNELNYDIIMWSIDTIDWREDSSEEKIIERVLKKPENSSIVLMHPTERTVKALPKIIDSLKDKGFSIGNISDVLE